VEYGVEYVYVILFAKPFACGKFLKMHFSLLLALTRTYTLAYKGIYTRPFYLVLTPRLGISVTVVNTFTVSPSHCLLILKE